MTSVQRERILACACDLYLSDGLEGFSMRKLAKTVGVTAPSLYRHFASKESVLIAVIGEAYRMFAQYLYRALAGATAAERMHRAGQEYLDFAIEHPEMYEMLYVSPHHLGLDDYPEEVAVVAGATGQFWQDRVRECIDAGILRDGDPDELSMTMWAHAHGLISIYLRGMCSVTVDNFRAVYLESSSRLMQGLAGPAWSELHSSATAQDVEGSPSAADAEAVAASSGSQVPAGGS